MNNFDFCIWGVRDGFEVIHSDNESWKNYLKSNSSVLDGKMQRLIDSRDEFYMLKINGSNQIFSLVVPSVDSGGSDGSGRATYMVISLISKREMAYDSNLFSVLHKIWGVYQRDNIIPGDTSKNIKGKHLTTNEFDLSEIRNEINTISAEDSNKFYREENCTIKIDDITLLKNSFGHFKGNDVYFIRQDSQESALRNFPSKLKFLKEIVSRGASTPEIEEFRILLKQKEKFERALPLFQRFQTSLSQQEIIDFSKWNDEIKIKTDVKRLSEYVSKSTLTEEEKAFIHHHLEHNTAAILELKNDEIERLKQRLTSSNDSQRQLANTLKDAIDNAKRNNWDENPKEWEEFLLKNPNINENLELKYKESLGIWRREFNKNEENSCEKDLLDLYRQIKNSKPSNKDDLEKFSLQFQSLTKRINSLDNFKTANRLENSKAYTELGAIKWEPTDWKKRMLKIGVPILILSILTGGYLWLANYQAEKALLAKKDTDRDGVVDAKDENLKTVWISDSVKFPLKKYVNSNGFIDASKTKSLCDCWEIPEVKEREILKCKNNLNWFVLGNKLYEYRIEDSNNGRFYESSELKIASNRDNQIEKEHERLFPEHYNKEEDIEVQNDPNKEYITITFENKHYRLKKGFTTEQGMEFGEKDRNNNDYIPHWKFKNGVWLKKATPRSNFLKADPDSQEAMNGKFIEKIEVGNNKVPTDVCDSCCYWLELEKKYGSEPSNLDNSKKDRIKAEIKPFKDNPNYKCTSGQGQWIRNKFIAL
jgi:hypothetical protein